MNPRGSEPSPDAVRSRQLERQIWEHWATILAHLQSQSTCPSRGGWVQPLIDALEQRLRLHLALERRLRGLSRFRLLQRLRNLLALLPLDAELQRAGRALLRDLNGEAVGGLEAHLAQSPANLVVVIVGCRARLPKLLNTIRLFATTSPDSSVIGVFGDSSLRDWEMRFDADSRVLRLPVSDAYEALPHKVGWATLALGLCQPAPAMLKIDDDAVPTDISAAHALLATLQERGLAAAGHPITTATPLSLDRGWHIGKSSARANRHAFDNLATRHWMSGGTGYLLAPTAVDIVSEYALHTWGFFQSMLYEDITISMILNAAEAQILWLDETGHLGINSERADEIDQGLWPHDESQLPPVKC